MTPSYVFLDSSCGYGAFLQLHDLFKENRFIGNDIDGRAISTAATIYPDISFFCKNALVQVFRDIFGISDSDPLIIIEILHTTTLLLKWAEDKTW